MKFKQIDVSKVEKDKHPDLEAGQHVVGRLKGSRECYFAGVLTTATFHPGGPTHDGLYISPSDNGEIYFGYSPVRLNALDELYLIQ